jgi:hypothetical protein
MRLKPTSKEDKCPWCGKWVKLTKKDACQPHLTNGKQQCCGAGIPRRNWPGRTKEDP